MKSMKRLSKFGLIVGALSAMVFASPASAATCVGTQQTAGICFEITKTTLYQDCVYLGEPPCTPVSVPGVDVDCWGWIGSNGDFMCA